MSETIHLNIHVADLNREQLQTWARANGLDPNIIPIPSNVTFDLDGGKVTVEQYILTEDGRTQLDPDREDAALRGTLTVDLVAPFPAEVLAVERLRYRIESDPA